MLSADESPSPHVPESPIPVLHRLVALLEVIVCSDFLTQLALSDTITMLGYGPYAAGRLRISYVVGLSLLDTILLIGLILFFLRAHGESAREVFLGRRPVADEVRVGIPLIFFALLIGIIVLVAIRYFAPQLHTVERNPLQDLVRTPRDAWLFAFVVLVAGGIREEVQRAFLLHRFERYFGGGFIGIIVTSTAFGTGHLLQGVDAAIATGLLGAFWGTVYLRRRSSVAPMVSHAGFDLVQVLQSLVK
jgi:membrane protease YdiL (CAAX protease family)